MSLSILYLLASFLVPLLPAYILYKTLPAETKVSGPFKGLNINLSGAFDGYFLLVLIAFAFSLKLVTDENNQVLAQLSRQNKQLNQENSALKNLYESWTIEGQIIANLPEKTKLFVDARNTHFSATGDFSSKLYIKKEANTSTIPAALCFFNTEDGYKVINLNKNTSKDFGVFGIAISEERKNIRIGKPVMLRKPVKFRDEAQ